MSRGFVNDATVIDAPLPEVLPMGAEEYTARVIGRLCESVTVGVDDHGLLVNYTQLPESVWREIARHFKIEVSTDDLRLMRQVDSRDAKRPQLRFEADGAQAPGGLRCGAAGCGVLDSAALRGTGAAQASGPSQTPSYNVTNPSTAVNIPSRAALHRRRFSGSPDVRRAGSQHDSLHSP